MSKNTIFFLLVTLFFFVGCNTKFSINGEYEEQAVVHFLLDQGEEFHFLKLNRTFLQEGDATEFAKDPDLSYFENVEAKVEEVKGGNVVREWLLKDTIIDNKKEGIFYAPEQKLYYFKADDLDQEAIYRLTIDIDNGNHIIKGQTALVKNVKINLPKPNQSFNFASNDVNANGYNGTSIVFTPGDAARIKMQVRIDYREYIGSEEVDKSLLWNIGELERSLMGGQSASLVAKGESFYEFLRNRIAVNDAVSKRKIVGMEIILTGSSDDLLTYVLANAPTSSLAQNKPSYSNLEGALGIFSSRISAKQYMNEHTPPNSRCLNKNSTKELCTGPYTAALKFCSEVPEDMNTSYYCN